MRHPSITSQTTGHKCADAKLWLPYFVARFKKPAKLYVFFGTPRHDDIGRRGGTAPRIVVR